MHGLWSTRQDFINHASTCLDLSTQVTIHNEQHLRNVFIDDLIYNAVFAKDEELKREFHTLIYSLSLLLKCPPSSIRPYYRSVGEGKKAPFTTAAFNIRTLTFESARCIFRLMKIHSTGAVVFEIARSEMEYTDQTPQEYTSCVLAAAIKESFIGPVFLQGDHFQLSKKKYTEDPQKEVERIEELIKTSLNAHFLNIDIDASPLVDLTLPSVIEQQKINSEITARLTHFIRSIEEKTEEVSIGGEIGHIGDQNSTSEDFEAFMTQFTTKVPRDGLSKISIQTGSSHGGTPLSDGRIKDVSIDFEAIKEIGRIAREKYHIGGVVQHGASTLPLSLYSQFVQHQTLEIHLATGLQNIFFDSLPSDLRDEMYTWIRETQGTMKEKNWTDEQFIYKTRKLSLGAFKQVLWDMEKNEKDIYLQNLSSYVEDVLTRLNLPGSLSTISSYVKI